MNWPKNLPTSSALMNRLNWRINPKVTLFAFGIALAMSWTQLTSSYYDNSPRTDAFT